jgi:hypothetical protein
MERADQSKANTKGIVLPTSSVGGGTEQQPLQCLIVGKIWKSQQNGMVYDPNGIAPCICVGCHSGVEPKIIVYV